MAGSERLVGPDGVGPECSFPAFLPALRQRVLFLSKKMIDSITNHITAGTDISPSGQAVKFGQLSAEILS